LPRPRLGVAAPLLRLRSDDQLVALFRGGSDDAFRAIHDRYRVRLLAYARQMLGGSTADAEDALQEVFVRVHAALLASSAPISLRAWLYRIAHNRCVDQLRRPSPIPSEIMPGAHPALCRGARHDPPAEAERSEDLRRLVSDVDALPEQQRSALLMRELQGLSYEELAVALGISVAAVKSLLLRARGGVLDAAAARDVPCAEIRLELVSAHDRGVRASGRARRHMRECDACCAYRGELREVSRRVAALVPVGPLGHIGLVFGLGGGGAGAGGGLAAGGSGALLGGAASVTATKVAALVCCAALVGSATELRSHPTRHRSRTGHAAPAAHPAPAEPAADPRVVARQAGGAIAPTPHRTAAATAAPPATPAASGGPPAPPLTGQDGYAATPGAGSGTPGAGAIGLTSATGTDPTLDATGGTAAGAADPASPATPASSGDSQTGASTTAVPTAAPAGPVATTSSAGTSDDQPGGPVSAPGVSTGSPATAPVFSRVAGQRRIPRRRFVRSPRTIGADAHRPLVPAAAQS
jgi:RNA polymerase sigma factor (sigma-70 family)